MAGIVDACFSEEEEDNAVVRVFRTEDSGSASSVSDDSELMMADYERKKSSSKAKLRALAVKNASLPPQEPHRNKDEEIEASLNKMKSQGKYVKLNVGGTLFNTTLGTLAKHDNMLRAMFSERIPLVKDEEGMVIVHLISDKMFCAFEYRITGNVALRIGH